MKVKTVSILPAKSTLCRACLLTTLLLLSVQSGSNALLANSFYVENSHSGSTDVSGIITQNTTWTQDDSPYVVVGDVRVDIDIFLTVEPGVTVKFANGASIIVDGCLTAKGDSTHRILFTSDNAIPTTGDWGTINIRDYSTYANLLENVRIEFATTAFTLAASCDIIDCDFVQNINGIALLDAPEVHIRNSQFMNNTGSGVAGFTTQNITIQNCSMTFNYQAVSITASATASLDNCTITQNMVGVTLNAATPTQTSVTNSNISYNTGDGFTFSCDDYGSESHLQMNDCTVSHNGATGLKGSGSRSEWLIQNCAFQNDTTGLMLTSDPFYGLSHIQITNCTITNHKSVGIEVGTALALVNNSIISGNPNGIYCGGGGSVAHIYDSDVSHNANGLVISTMSPASASVNVYNSTIIDNSQSGVEMNSFSPAFSSKLGLQDCDVSHNSRGIAGAGDITGTNNKIRYNSVGIVQDPYGSVTFESSTFANNTFASIESQGTVDLDACAVYNSAVGIRGNSVTLRNSHVFNNSECNVKSLTNTEIESCNIYNSSVGVETGSGAIRYSNIYSNSEYNLRNTASTDVDATNDWWGTTSEILINVHILDYYDNFSLGRVFYKPFLTEPFTPHDTTPPEISEVSRAPTLPNCDDSVTVSATITDDDAVDRAILSYNHLSWIHITMAQQGNEYLAVIPSWPYGTSVQYKVTANDTSGNSETSEIYSYTVADTKAPQILSIDASPICPDPYVPSNVTRANEPTLITANLTEPLAASGLVQALFSYRVDSGNWWNTSMNYDPAAGFWTTTIPAQSNNTNTVEFLIKAYDNAGNVATSPVQAFNVKPLLAADINGDGKVDMRDIGYAARHFGENYV